MTDTATRVDLDAIRARAAAADNGPWMWRGSLTYGSGPFLATRKSGRGEYTIMDFCRRGMQGAQPRFQRADGLMDRATNPGVAIFEVCRDCLDPKDSRVYRDDIVGFRNGNAEFIAAARQDVDDLLAYIDDLHSQLEAQP
jgi:hypothetical protein